MEARLKAIMEMDASEVQKELIKTANELKKFERELAKSTDTKRIGELTSKISELNSKMTQLAPAMSKVGNATAAVGGAMSKSQTNAMNFSRVIQDLPFGFMGIQNNLTQLIPGIGAAGIAFSALTAAITFSQVGLTYWTRSSKAAKEAQDSFSKSMNEGFGDVAAETANLKALALVINDTTQSTEVRERALAKLKDTYKGNIDLQKIDINDGAKLAKIIDTITGALMRKAQAEVFSKMIAEEQAKAAKIQNESLQDSVEELGMAEKAWNALKATVTAGNPALVAAQLKISNIQDALTQKYDALKKVNKNIATYTQLLNANTLASIQNNDAGTLSTTAEKKTKTTNTVTTKDTAISRMISINQDWQQKKGKNWWRRTQTERGADLTMQDTTKLALGENKQLNQILAERSDIQRGLNEQMAQANGIAEYGGAVFGQMAMAMMQGTSIGDVLATTFKNLVSQLIQAVAQAAIFAAIMSAISPGASFGTLFGSAFGGGSGGGAMNILGMISGQNIQLSNNRTGTGMGYRRGRR